MSRTLAPLGAVAGTLFALLVACGADDSDSAGTGGDAGADASGAQGTGAAPASGGASSGGTVGNGGGPPVASDCAQPSDCALRAESCCGSCGAPSRTDVLALRVDALDAYAALACGAETACPACAAMPDPTLLATCADGTCAVTDLLTHPSTTCSSAADCHLRAPECCECGFSGDAGSVIAVSDGVAYAELVCGPVALCAACLPVYPNLPVDCVAGHCVVVRP